jgi:hypothetical protein
MKKLLLVIAAGFALSAVAMTASAQHSHGGGSMGGGGGWHGGGGGSWHGGGGSWHGGGGHWHGGSSVAIGIGFPYWGWGWPYYGYPYYGYAYGYPYPYGYGYSDYAGPQSYIQRDTGDAVAPPPSGQYSSQPPEYSQPQYSYYCTNPAGYYPQVGTCPSGWLKVVPNGAPH